MAVPGARAKIQEAVLAWEGVTAHPHRFGGTEFQLGNCDTPSTTKTLATNTQWRAMISRLFDGLTYVRYSASV